jgi:hypothetical protein
MVSFQTSRPPFGGQAAVVPLSGFVAETQFNISISQWQTTKGPVKYRVWSTQTSFGLKPKSLLSNQWLNASQVFSFYATSTNPFLIEISDQTNEVFLYKLSAVIKVKASNTTINGTVNSTTMIQQMESYSSDYGLKYAYMDTITQEVTGLEN